MEISKRENTLQLVNPSLAKQFHPTKNGNLTPYDVTYGSRINVWWRCEKGHEWEAEINNRNHGNGCPYCSGNKVGKYNNLAVKNPKLAKEWHPTKNGNLTPYDVFPKSNKKVWWLCEKEHEWEAEIKSRTNGAGCTFCSGRRASKEINLAVLNPKLAKEWHPTKNGNLTPYDVTLGCGQKVWWRCEKGHEWEAQINSRNRGRGCRFCARQRE